MIKPQYLLVILLVWFANLNAQKTDSIAQKSDSKNRKNALRVEFFGRGALYGLYYERNFNRARYC